MNVISLELLVQSGVVSLRHRSFTWPMIDQDRALIPTLVEHIIGRLRAIPPDLESSPDFSRASSNGLTSFCAIALALHPHEQPGTQTAASPMVAA